MIWKFSGAQRGLLTVALFVALILSALIPPLPARAQGSPPPSYTLDECDQISEASLRDELNRITQTVFAQGQAGIDIQALVNRNWIDLNIDAAVDEAVAAATQQVREEERLWDRIISGWSPKKAEDLTRKVAQYAFASETFRSSFDRLSGAISADIVSEIRLLTAQSASSALLCVQTYIGDQMSPTLASVLAADIQAKLENIQFPEEENPNLLSILSIVEANPKLAGGVAVIVGTQIAKSLGQRLAHRIAGRVLGRILARATTGAIPLVGWIIGAGLIVWDLFNAEKGSLPQIQSALQDQEVKSEIRTQVVEKVRHEVRMELPPLARSVANEVYSQWIDFRKKYARVLELAKTNVRFQKILQFTPVTEVKNLAEFVATLESKYGSIRLADLIDRGLLERLSALPPESLEMIVSDVAPEVVIEWAELAGERIGQVISLKLYRVALPTDFTDRTDLERVLVLNDAERIQKLMLLDRAERSAVLGLPTSYIEQVLKALSSEDLAWLAKNYLTKLEPQERNRVVDRILREPDLILELKKELVQSALLESKDFEKTLNYIAQKTSPALGVGQVANILAMIGPALSGEPPWSLFWHYERVVLRNALYAVAALFILAFIIWRMLTSRRQRQDTHVTVILPEDRGGNEFPPDVRRTERRSREGK